jgi:hypothetical protein
VLLSKVTSSAGNIVDDITYKELVPPAGGSNLGTTSSFYSSSDAVTYPLVEIQRLPGTYLVERLSNTSAGVLKHQDFQTAAGSKKAVSFST